MQHVVNLIQQSQSAEPFFPLYGDGSVMDQQLLCIGDGKLLSPKRGFSLELGILSSNFSPWYLQVSFCWKEITLTLDHKDQAESLIYSIYIWQFPSEPKFERKRQAMARKIQKKKKSGIEFSIHVAPYHYLPSWLMGNCIGIRSRGEDAMCYVQDTTERMTGLLSLFCGDFWLRCFWVLYFQGLTSTTQNRTIM